MRDLERQRVAVTVFADVKATNKRDAGHIVEYLIQKALRPSSTHDVTISGETLTVTIHDVMETGMAAGNGYLWTSPTSKAFNQYQWQVDANQESSDD